MTTNFTGKIGKSDMTAHLAVNDGYLSSSDCETVSIARADALSTSKRQIGPDIPVISEYADSENRSEVGSCTPEACQGAVTAFVGSWARDGCYQFVIARRAQKQFFEILLGAHYRGALNENGLFEARASIQVRSE
jgi:hypothetical protein